MAGEALLALGDAGRPDCSLDEDRRNLLFGPLLAAAAADGVLRLAEGDLRSPPWPDSIFMRSGPAQAWSRLLQAVDETWARRGVTASPSTEAAMRFRMGHETGRDW
jgi:hypothetical protein